MGGESAGEGGVMGVLERERLSCKAFGSLPDEERFASFTAAQATFQERVSRSNRTGMHNTTEGETCKMDLLCHKLRSLDRRFTPVSPNLTLETHIFEYVFYAKFSKRRRGR
jgi:hypothetical protein